MHVYLNGTFLPADEAFISPDDRGFLLADGVYEVIRAYPGGTFEAAAHEQRLRDGLEALRIDADAGGGVLEAGERLLELNGLRGRDATIYIQVTRGAAPRRHAFPAAGTPPTIYVATRPFRGYPRALFESGCRAITVPDTRWARCDIKSIALLPNVLANQAAHDADAFEALFVRDGVVVEGSHSNVFAVIDDTVITHPLSSYMLSGITRAVVLRLAQECGLRVEERALAASALDRVQELFLTGTTTDLLPIAAVDGRPVGRGEPGPVTRRLMEEFERATPARVSQA